MEQTAALILNDLQIKHKIKRIAYQIYENNVDEKRIILAGIAPNGFVLAQKLQEELEHISKIATVLCKVELDKKNPLKPVKTSLEPKEYEHRSLVLIDDVLNSGTTLIYAVRHFLAVPLKQFKTAVLVNRGHKKYPVKADYKGISLSTSLSETVKVSFSPEASKAELF